MGLWVDQEHHPVVPTFPANLIAIEQGLGPVFNDFLFVGVGHHRDLRVTFDPMHILIVDLSDIRLGVNVQNISRVFDVGVVG